jgi:outer membrane PBP1 activator LpoA protein
MFKMQVGHQIINSLEQMLNDASTSSPSILHHAMKVIQFDSVQQLNVFRHAIYRNKLPNIQEIQFHLVHQYVLLTSDNFISSTDNLVNNQEIHFHSAHQLLITSSHQLITC